MIGVCFLDFRRILVVLRSNSVVCIVIFYKIKYYDYDSVNTIIGYNTFSRFMEG